MGFNASLGNPTWCLGEFAYVRNESLAFAARVKKRRCRQAGAVRHELLSEAVGAPGFGSF